MRTSLMLIVISMPVAVLACEGEELPPIDSSVIKTIANGKQACEETVRTFPALKKIDELLDVYERAYGRIDSLDGDYDWRVTEASSTLHRSTGEFRFDAALDEWGASIYMAGDGLNSSFGTTMRFGTELVSVEWQTLDRSYACYDVPDEAGCYDSPEHSHKCIFGEGSYSSKSKLPMENYSVKDGSAITTLTGTIDGDESIIQICQSDSCRNFRTTKANWISAQNVISKTGGGPFVPARIGGLRP